MERDPQTGHFLPGNRVAVGNKGNYKPKWGNKNAVTHGWYRKLKPYKIHNGYLYIILSQNQTTRRINAIRLQPDQFQLRENGSVSIHDGMTYWLDRLDVKLESRISE